MGGGGGDSGGGGSSASSSSSSSSSSASAVVEAALKRFDATALGDAKMAENSRERLHLEADLKRVVESHKLKVKMAEKACRPDVVVVCFRDYYLIK
jgi:hypothetical protein